MKKSKSEVVHLISGGADSTVAAILLAREFKRVHLINFNHGYHVLGNIYRRIQDLQRKFGRENFVFNRINIKKFLFKNFAAGRWMDMWRHGGFAAFCISCETAFITVAMIYALRNGIKYISLGASKEENQNPPIPMQIPAVMKIWHDKLLKKYGLKIVTPLKELDREDEFCSREAEICFLQKMNFDLGREYRGIGGRRTFYGIQNICIPGACHLILLDFMPALIRNIFYFNERLPEWTEKMCTVANRILDQEFQGRILEKPVAQKDTKA